MKKKFLLAIVVSFIFTLACYNIVTMQNEDPLSHLVLANVEALARYELPEVEIVCGDEDGNCWVASGDCTMGWFIRYTDCVYSGSTGDHCVTPCPYEE